MSENTVVWKSYPYVLKGKALESVRNSSEMSTKHTRKDHPQ